MSKLFTVEELADGFVDGNGASKFADLDEERINIIKGTFPFIFL